MFEKKITVLDEQMTAQEFFRRAEIGRWKKVGAFLALEKLYRPWRFYPNAGGN